MGLLRITYLVCRNSVDAIEKVIFQFPKALYFFQSNTNPGEALQSDKKEYVWNINKDMLGYLCVCVWCVGGMCRYIVKHS